MIYFKNNKNGLDSIDDIYEKYSLKEFKSPFRSTIPLLVLFKNNKLQDLQLFKLIDNENIKYIFEYEVPVQKGTGKASSTDLMIINKKNCIAIEAKRTEPKYETVEKWLNDCENRKQVLKGWLKLIEKATNIKIEQQNIGNFPYQLIHRTASACILNKKKTSIVYLGFDLTDKMNNYYENCLNQFSKILKNKIYFYLITYKIQKSNHQEKLEKKWTTKKSRDLSNEITNGLKHKNLMKFKLINI